MAKLPPIVRLLSSEPSGCDRCGLASEIVDATVNHFINDHDYRLLHVGQETAMGPDGYLRHATAFVLARPNE